MRVLQLSTWDATCGIADYTASLHSHLVNRGVDVDVWPVDRVANNYLSQGEIEDSFRLFTEAATEYDVVHVQHEFSFFAGSYGAKTSVDIFAALLQRLRRAGTPAVTTFHTHPRAIEPPGRRRFGLLTGGYFRAKVGTKFGTRNGATAIAHNRLTRRALIDSGFAKERIEVIPIGMPTADPGDEAARADSKRAIGISPLDVVIGMFGFFTESKGHMTALEAMRALPSNFHLLIVGGPHPHAPRNPLDTVLKWLHDNPDLAERVHLAGYVDAAELPALLVAVDIHVAPYSDVPILSSSAAITRAMASGRPVIATRIPAFLEINELFGECLALSTPGAPYELAHRIESLIDDADLAKELIRNCEALASENNWATVAKRHSELYEQLVR